MAADVQYEYPPTRRQRIADLGEKLDAHRKRQMALHPGLTMTGMYNVLEKLRAGESLSPKEIVILDQGRVDQLKQIHDELDANVFAAYGWPPTLTDEEILERLVALNAERAAEEKRGLIRWLRPEYQIPLYEKRRHQQPETLDADVDTETVAVAVPPRKKVPWPKAMLDQVKAVRLALQESAGVVSIDDVAGHFTRANRDALAEILESLVTIGRARRVGAGFVVG